MGRSHQSNPGEDVAPTSGQAAGSAPAILWLFLVTALVLPSGPLQAWESAAEVVHGSSRVLEKGETMVGILSPLGYGVHERVTVFTHPALLLLLTPSLWARLAILEGSAGLALEGGYQQSWLYLITQEGGTGSGKDEMSAPGTAQLGLIWSQLLAPNIQLNVAGGYLAEFGRADRADRFSGLYWRIGADFLFKEVNLLLAEVRGKFLVGEDFAVPTGTILFARQLGRARLGFGACFGRFGPEQFPDVLDKPLFVYPWLDVWWRF